MIYQVFNPEYATTIIRNIDESKWQQGKARTEELTGTVKQNEEILDTPALREIGKKIINHRGINLDHVPYQLYKPKFSRYQNGAHYKIHTDSPWMGETRTDLACTLWLNSNYEGGELVVNGVKYKGEPGQAMVYPCELPHEVLPVTEGSRICVITWIQSRIRDRHKRKLVSDFRKYLAKFEDNQELFVEGGRIHSALIRMWMD